MENNHLNNPNTPQHSRHGKDKGLKTQVEKISQYLNYNVATASMVSASTGVPQKNITRYKRLLEKAGQLWEVEKKRCELTGFKAWYLTTNPELNPGNNQLKIFDD
jgi:hypothetical protein